MRNFIIYSLSIVLPCIATAFVLSYIAEESQFFGNNFPSHHALYSSVVAIPIIGKYHKLGIIACVLAFGVGVWRFAGGYHEVYEVIGAWIISIISVFVVLVFYINREKLRGK